MKEEIIKDNNEKTPWVPTYTWYAKIAGVILVVLLVTFFILNILLKPYMRERPAEITPWLKKSKVSAEQKYKNKVLKTEIIEEDAGNEK